MPPTPVRMSAAPAKNSIVNAIAINTVTSKARFAGFSICTLEYRNHNTNMGAMKISGNIVAEPGLVHVVYVSYELPKDLSVHVFNRELIVQKPK